MFQRGSRNKEKERWNCVLRVGGSKFMLPGQSTPSMFRNCPARGEPWHSPRCCLSSCWPMYRWPRTPPQEKTVCFPAEARLCCVDLTLKSPLFHVSERVRGNSSAAAEAGFISCEALRHG
jgi:hypothetical protein